MRFPDNHPTDLVEAAYDADGVEVAAGSECLIPAGGPASVLEGTARHKLRTSSTRESQPKR